MGFEAGCESAAVDVVKLVCVQPWIFGIIDLPVAVGWSTVAIRSVMYLKERKETYKSGWMGLRSVPITFAEGNWAAKSMAHIPVPVAISRTLWRPPGRSFIGALYNSPSRVRRKRWC